MRSNHKIAYSMAVMSIASFAFWYSVSTKHASLDRNNVVHDTITVESDWSKLIASMAFVESNGNPNALNNKSGAAGLLQLMPEYVQEVNRVANEYYSMEDRFDDKKSIDMFNAYQAYYNPERDIAWAIRLHNPNAGDWYSERIYNAMNAIREIE